MKINGKKAFFIGGNDISDGYHTFKEIYNHRKILYILLCIQHANQCYWADHKEWNSIVLVWNSEKGQISYHVSYDMKPMFQDHIKEIPFSEHKYDGHSSEDVLHRLMALTRP